MVDVEKVFDDFYVVSEGDVAIWVAIEPTWNEAHPLAWSVQHEEVEICSCYELEHAITVAGEIVTRGVLSLGD